MKIGEAVMTVSLNLDSQGSKRHGAQRIHRPVARTRTVGGP